MKNILSCTKTAIILLLATILLLGCYVYMLARPISYGWEYHTKTEYEGVAFEGTTVYERGNKMYTCNNSFPEPLEYFYFYKIPFL